MFVDDRAGNACLPRDGLDRHATEALLDDARGRHVEQLLTPFAGGHTT
jgi:hypothetical protein